MRKRDLETRKEKDISAGVIVERVCRERQELNTDDHAIRWKLLGPPWARYVGTQR